jgi:hypothetical protein
MIITGVVDSLHMSIGGVRATIKFYDKTPKTDMEEAFCGQTITIYKEDPLLSVGDEVNITIERKYK